MASTQKCIRIENPLLKAFEEAMKREHLDLSPIIKRSMWLYLEQQHPDLFEQAKKEVYGSS